MFVKDLRDLSKGKYSLVQNFYIPFTKIKLFTRTLGYVIVSENNSYLTMSKEAGHNRFSNYPCIGFKLNDNGERVNFLSKNLIGFMQKVVDESKQEAYFNEFLFWLNKADSMVKVGE